MDATQNNKMTAFIIRTSEYQYYPRVKEFNSLEELLSFQRQSENNIIISTPYSWDENWGEEPDFQIEIYDDYRE